MANKPVDGLPVIAIERLDVERGLWLHDHILSRRYLHEPAAIVKSLKAYPTLLRAVAREWAGETLVGEVVLSTRFLKGIKTRQIPRGNLVYLPPSGTPKKEKSVGARVIRAGVRIK